MSKQTKTTTTTDAKTATVAEKLFTVADVARELKLEPKRARAFLRKHAKLYTMRKTRFAKTSQQYRDAVAALKQMNAPKTVAA